MNASIAVTLSSEEALVLFEWLTRCDSAGLLEVEDGSEQRVLWKLEGQLEKQLVATLAPNYRELLTAARAAVRDEP